MLVASSRWRNWAGAVLGLAILCKLLPAALFPAFWRRWDWRTLGGTVAVIVALYALYAVGAGWHVLGYLPGYATEEGLATGSGFFILRMLSTWGPLPPWVVHAYLALSALLLLGLAAAFMLGRSLPSEPGPRIRAIGQAGAILALATTLILSPHYPWYFGWLSLFACFVPYRSIIFLSASSVMVYLDPYHREAIYPWLVYGPCLALGVGDVVQTYRTRHAA
jgi:hypothetical protein